MFDTVQCHTKGAAVNEQTPRAAEIKRTSFPFSESYLLLHRDSLHYQTPSRPYVLDLHRILCTLDSCSRSKKWVCGGDQSFHRRKKNTRRQFQSFLLQCLVHTLQFLGSWVSCKVILTRRCSGPIHYGATPTSQVPFLCAHSRDLVQRGFNTFEMESKYIINDYGYF